MAKTQKRRTSKNRGGDSKKPKRNFTQRVRDSLIRMNLVKPTSMEMNEIRARRRAILPFARKMGTLSKSISKK